MYITYVQDFGPFLKVFGQVQNNIALELERVIKNITPIINNKPPPNQEFLKPSLICLSRYTDGNFYRSSITGILGNGFVSVYFLDYGNEEKIPVSEIRLLDFDQSNSEFLLRSVPQANCFILSRICGKWNNQILDIIRKDICNENIPFEVEDQAGGFTFIKLTVQGFDYSEALTNTKKIGTPVLLPMQKNVILNQMNPKSVNPNQKSMQTTNISSLQSRLIPDSLNLEMADSNHSITRQSIMNLKPARPVYEHPNRLNREILLKHTGPNMPNYHPPSQNSLNAMTGITNNSDLTQFATKPLKAITKTNLNSSTSIATYKSNALMIGTTHDVYCSYVEDGPNLFSVQLASTEDDLCNLMNQLENVTLKNLSEKPSLGMACIARFSEDNQLYRAVIVSINATSCLVSYIDYGNSESVSYQNIYEAPPELLKEKIFAMRFTLSGYKQLNPLSNAVKKKFREITNEKKLKLLVTPLEGSPFVQYCELYDGNQNIFDILKKYNNQPQPILTFSQPMVMEKNYTGIVTIRYVESPQKFFVQPVNNAPMFEDLMDRLLYYCNKAPLFTDIREGAVCAAKFHEDNEWYRAQIIKINGDKILVKFVDFGNTQEVTKHVLKEITSEFILTPAQAIECCLVGFENSTTIPDSARVQLEMISENEHGERKQFKLHVIDKLTNSVALVKMFDENIEPPLDISKRMYKLTMPQKKFNDFSLNKNQQFERSNNKYEKQILNSTLIDAKDNKPNHNNWDNVRNEDWNSPSNNRSNAPNNDAMWSTDSTRQPQKNMRGNETTMWSTNTQRQTQNSKRGNETTMWTMDSTKQRNTKSNETTNNWSPEQNLNKSRDSWSGESSDNNSFSRRDNRNDPRKNKFGNTENNNYFNRDKGESRGGYKSGGDKPSRDYGNNQNTGNNYFERKDRGQQRDQRGADGAYSKYTFEGKKISDSTDTSGKYTESSSEKYTEHDSTINSVTPSIQESFVPFTTEFLSPIIKMNVLEEVSISWWTSPHEFYIYLKSELKNLEKMMKEIQIFYKNRQNEPTLIKPNINSSIITRYAKDNLYCRAKIVDYNENINKYRVAFVDFGNEAIVTLENIWEIEERFMKLPKIAIQCSLIDIVSNYDYQTIVEKIDMYIQKKDKIQCEFIKTENNIHFVEINVNGSKLKELFINDDIVSSLPDDIKLSCLRGQVIRIKFVSIKNLNCFRILIDGCDTILMCSYSDMKFGKNNPKITEEFLNLYVDKTCAAKVDSVSQDNILLITPYIPLLNNIQAPLICNYPVLSDKPNVKVTYVESINTVYVHISGAITIFDHLLDTMFEFYTTNGENLDIIEISKLCAAKSHDGNWYRSIVLSDDESNVKVQYLDCGNTEIVPKQNLKMLEKCYCVLSALATKIYLPINVISTTNENKKSSENVISEITCLTASFELTLNLLDYIDDSWIGDICSQGKCMTDLLISKNLVTRVELKELHEQIKNDNMQRVKLFEEATNDDDKINELIENSQPQIQIPGIEGIIRHVDYPDRFYIQLVKDLPNIEQLQVNLQIIGQSLPQLTELKQGTLCIAQYSADENWYRARIIDNGQDVTTIQFIDFGNTDVITENGQILIKQMNEAFINPDQYAIQCSLPMRPNDGQDWNEKSVEYLYNQLDQIIKFEHLSKGGPINYIRLLVDNDGKDLSNILCSEGLGKKLEIIKSGEAGFISHINSLSDFYIQLENEIDKLELISAYLNDKEFAELEDFSVGTICRALFPEDGNWYRAKILFHSNQGTEVLFIDYGNTALTTNLTALEQCIAELNVLSKKCTLNKPNYIGKWTEEAEEKFHELSAMGQTIFIVDMCSPGDNNVTVNLSIDNKNILDELEILCEKQNIINYENMTESIVESSLNDTSSSNENLKGQVCYVNSPNDFYVHLESDLHLLDNLKLYFEENSQNLQVLLEKVEGKLCAALFTEDRLFYRAEIISVANDGCDVLFVDYGNISFVTDLRILPDEMASIKPIAQHYGLENKLFSNEWDSASSSKFIDLTAGGETTFHINIVDKTTDPYLVKIQMGPIDVNNELIKLIKTSDLHHQTQKKNVNKATNLEFDKHTLLCSDMIINEESENSQNYTRSNDSTVFNDEVQEHHQEEVNEKQLNERVCNSEMAKLIINEVLEIHSNIELEKSRQISEEVINEVLEKQINAEFGMNNKMAEEIINEVLDKQSNINVEMANDIVTEILEHQNQEIENKVISAEISSEQLIEKIVNEVMNFPEQTKTLRNIDSQKLRTHLWKSLEKLPLSDKNSTISSSTSSLSQITMEFEEKSNDKKYKSTDNIS